MRWLFLAAILTGCSGGTTSGGNGKVVLIDSQYEQEIFKALGRLDAEDRAYVLRHVKRFEDGLYTSAEPDDGTVFIGPDFADDTLTWQASLLVHEAAHIELGYDMVNGEERNTPRRERDAIVRQGVALHEMGAYQERDYVLGLDGSHCIDNGACPREDN